MFSTISAQHVRGCHGSILFERTFISFGLFSQLGQIDVFFVTHFAGRLSRTALVSIGYEKVPGGRALSELGDTRNIKRGTSRCEQGLKP